MKVSLKDIAKELGISTAAVSKALNDLPGVSDALRVKVKQTAQRMGYTKYIKASIVNAYERKMKFIAVLYGPVGGNLVGEIQAGIDDQIRRRGYYELRYMIDTFHDMDTERQKELFLSKISEERGMVGVLSCYVKLSDVLISKLYKQNLPVVLLESETEFGRCVTIDNVRASYKAASKLVELGRRKIGCVMPPEDSDRIWHDRFTGYRRALRDAGIQYDPSLIVYENWIAVKPGGLATKMLLEQNPGVDAVLYGSDKLAYGGLKMLRDLGKKVPQDVAVIGFDDEELSIAVQPSLSSVRQPIRKMAETGLTLLLDSIEKGDLSPRNVQLDTELMLRGSCVKDYKEDVWR